MARLVAQLAAGVRQSDLPVAGALIYQYQPGGTTPSTYLYTDNTLLVAASNPVALDADGKGTFYCSDTANFRLRVRNAADTTTIDEWDPAVSSGGTTLADITAGATLADCFTSGASETADDVIGFLWTGFSGQSSAATAKDLRVLHTGTGAVGRYLRAMISERFDILDFGATGNDSTDNQAAIQAAIDAAEANGGGAVIVPPGIFRVQGTLTIDSPGVAVFGHGPASIVKADGFSNAAIFTVSGASTDRIEFASVHLQGAGGSGTTGAVGISVASTVGDTAGEVPVNIHDCIFGGPADGTGLNVGVDALGQRGSVSNCFFHRIYNASAGYGVRIVTGSYWTIASCRMRLTDGAAARGAYGVGGSSGGDSTKVVGCHIEGAGVSGIYFYGANQTAFGNTTTGCSGYGISVTGATNASISGNNCYSNGNGGIVLSGYCNGFSITGNSCSSNTTHGIYVTNVDDSTTTTPRNGVISGNTCRNNTQSGIALVGSEKVLVSNNSITDNGSNGTYPAIDVRTSRPDSIHRGGNYNAIIGNSVWDTSGSIHSAPIRISDQAGGVTNVSTTVVMGNYFPPVTGGTTSYIWGVANQMPNNWIGNITNGFQRAVHNYTSSDTLTISQSGSMVTNFGATGSVTLTLPDLTAGSAVNDGIEFTCLRCAGFDLVLAAGSGDQIFDSAGSPDSTMTLTAYFAVKIISRSNSWFCITDGP